ncbi:transketolase C-terminal domain-containing protein [Nocardiopsis sp. NPDC006832]|uniref:transketolase family protein n=1 Tax=Nocardiopsis sp. NPDC006832 TaxID=3157188 RepID=UPI0033F6315F
MTERTADTLAPPTRREDVDWADHYAVPAREVYRRTLVELAERDPRVFCLDTDMGGLESGFAERLPEQYVNVGIAEMNLMGVSAGLAAGGLLPYANTLSGFATARACEAFKVDVAGNDLPVRVVVTHGGASSGHYGPTHHALDDIAIARTLPNMTVVVPCDAAETERAVRATTDLEGPLFLRLGRAATPVIGDASAEFTLGRARVLRDGGDVTIVAAGPHPVHMAVEAAHALEARGVSTRVLNMHTIKPIDREALIEAARETRGIVTVEDHLEIGGLGAAVCEVVSTEHPCPVRRVGFPDAYLDFVADERDLLTYAGISPERIEREALAMVRR